MTITAEKKSELIQEHRSKDADTGSPQVQIAILSERINALQSHFKSNTRTTPRGGDSS